MTTRRIMLALAAALPLLASGAARAQDAVSLRLNWYLGGLHVPYYYGVEKGYFKAEGIDLTINEGRGSGNTVQVVAAGSDTVPFTATVAARVSRPSAGLKGDCTRIWATSPGW